jgi:hypothetical protein
MASTFIKHIDITTEARGFKVQVQGVQEWEDMVDSDGNVEIFRSEVSAQEEADDLAEQVGDEHRVVPAGRLAPSSR